MRLQQPIFTNKPAQSIRLRVTATDVPTSAAVRVTDIQLQPGQLATGVVPNPAEAGTTPSRSQYRSGVVAPGLEVVALSNSDQSAPTRMELVNSQGSAKIGSYNFQEGASTGVVDGLAHTANRGYGFAPVITARQDLNLKNQITRRAHLRLAWKERT